VTWSQAFSLPESGLAPKEMEIQTILPEGYQETQISLCTVYLLQMVLLTLKAQLPQFFDSFGI
jgi:hypothetical protein